jgi:hypothetical protein
MMLRKFLVNTLVLGAFCVLVLVNITAASAAPNSTTVQDNDPDMMFDFWATYGHSLASGGSLQQNYYPGSTAQFRFSGTSITWVTRKGNYAGKAQVLIDGVNKGTFDLYAISEQYQVQYAFGNLSDTKHTIVIRVLGVKNPAATQSYVAVDAFIVGGVTTQDNSPKIKYDSWQGKVNSHASGGTFRVSSEKGARVFLRSSFYASSIRWITAMGPSYGKARVSIDNVDMGIVDLYAPAQQWQVVKTFSGLDDLLHQTSITPLHKKNKASTGYRVIVDALQYQ